jgi:ABC-type multidrug transport system fused ATPase/permease subunit
MPAIQQIFAGAAHVRFSLAQLDQFDRQLQALAQSAPPAPAAQVRPIAFTRTAALVDVVYTYPGAAAAALIGVNLSIQRNTTVGLVGATGSGKSTAVDVLLGLLQPQRGSLCIDGTPVSGAGLFAWQRLVGYVTQSPHIIDDTIARNIALGVPDAEIKMEDVREAARLANLAEFIETDLPVGYETKVGERGSRLSGGQRQRLCIARALYHDPEVLVFDEATSAVDAQTEDAIIEAIRTLSHRKTIVMISHRLASLKDCDVIHVFEAGKIIDQGTYESLRERSAKFRNLAGVTES